MNLKLLFGKLLKKLSIPLILDNSIFIKRKGVKLSNCNIVLRNGSKLTLSEGVRLFNCDIILNNADISIGKDSIIGEPNNCKISCIGGMIKIDNNCVIKADVSVRFGGNLDIGEYTAINQSTTIRVDRNMTIGSFCMISTECLLFDTNTHQILDSKIRREMTRRDYPAIGKEVECPNTGLVKIGDDVWIGQRAVILKNTIIGDDSIIGTSSVVSNITCTDKSVLVGNPAKVVKVSS